MRPSRNRITDEQVAAIPFAELVHAVDEAYRALGRGEIFNPPRQERLGRAEAPNFFRLESSAEWRGVDGELLWRCRKVIEEASGADALGGRSPGARTAWIELEEMRCGRTVLLDAEAITNLRTGISALFAARYLTPARPVTLALIGTGRVARAAALAACSHSPHLLSACA